MSQITRLEEIRGRERNRKRGSDAKNSFSARSLKMINIGKKDKRKRKL